MRNVAVILQQVDVQNSHAIERKNVSATPSSGIQRPAALRLDFKLSLLCEPPAIKLLNEQATPWPEKCLGASRHRAENAANALFQAILSRGATVGPS
jgi:hypothetical protein